ncbi:hypothetical protein D918_02622 [Trichuris suis]|nr:hypothetical protein D918_02622 [Trichuris suis]
MEETENTSAPPTQARDSSGILRTKISLGRKPSIIMPFYLMKNELPNHAWNKFCNNKKLKEELSAFMPNLPGNIDAAGHKDGSSLRQLIEKPPICGKEILPLGSAETVGFRLLPGSIPEEYRSWSVGPSNAADKKKRKRKHENILGEEGPEEDAEKRAKQNDGNGKPRFYSANDSGYRLFEFLTTTVVLGSTKRLSQRYLAKDEDCMIVELLYLSGGIYDLMLVPAYT